MHLCSSFYMAPVIVCEVTTYFPSSILNSLHHMQPGCHQWSRCWIEWSPKSLSVHTLRMWTAVLAAECDDWTLPKTECRSARTKIIGVHHHHHSNHVNVIIALHAVSSILLEYTDHYSMSRSTAFLRFKKLGFADKVVVGTIVIILNMK